MRSSLLFLCLGLVVLSEASMFISPLQQQISLALNRQDCDLYANQFTSDAEFYGVVPGSPLPVAQGRDEIEQNCQKMLQFGQILSSPSRSLEYNTTFDASLSSYLFFPQSSSIATNLSKVAIGLAGANGKFKSVMEFASDEAPPAIYTNSLLTTFLGLGTNCTEFTEYMTNNVTVHETNYPSITGKRAVYATCKVRVSTLGYSISAINQMYYNQAIPQAVAVEFADTAPDGFRRGVGLFWLNDDGYIYSGTIFGGLGGTIE